MSRKTVLRTMKFVHFYDNCLCVLLFSPQFLSMCNVYTNFTHFASLEFVQIVQMMHTHTHTRSYKSNNKRISLKTTMVMANLVLAGILCIPVFAFQNTLKISIPLILLLLLLLAKMFLDMHFYGIKYTN